MNNGTFCSPGSSGLSGYARARFTQDHYEKMNDATFNNGGSNAQQNQMTGPGYGSSTAGYRSQIHGQSQGQDFGLTNTSEDDGISGRPTPNFGNSEFASNSQYQGHNQYAQHPRFYPGTAPSKPSMSMHSVHSMTAGSVGPSGSYTANQNPNFSPQRMHSGTGQTFGGPPAGTTPTLNHLLQSSSTSINQKGSSTLPPSSYSNRDENTPSSLQSKSEMTSPSQSSYSSMHQQQGWGSNARSGSHHYLYPPQGPGSSLYRSQSGGNNDMSQGRRPAMGAMGGSYPQQGGQYMNQQMGMGPGPTPQRFMMGGQMPNQMYGHTPSQQPPQMYMPPTQQQPPGPPVSPAARPPTPQQSQLQQMQNMVQNSPKQPSPAPSVSSDHGSTHSTKQGDESQDTKTEPGNPEDPSGENSRGSTGAPRPAPSPVGSTGSRSNTPASIPGAQAGSPMPVRPPSGQLDGQNRMTQSPMATQGYNQQMMPPPNSMGYMPGTGKMSSNQMQGHYPPFNSQYPQGNYGRQQPNMGGMGGPPMSGPMQNYPGSQPNMYPNGPGQMPGGPMYGNMPGMVRGIGQQGYGPGPGPGPYPQGGANMGGMMNSQYPGYNSHMGPMPGQHGMQQQPPQQQQQPSGPGPMPPGSAGGPMVPNMGGQPGNMMPQQHSGSSSNKAAQAAQAAMMAAANSVGPRMSHNRGSMSPSRGMFGQSGAGGGPLAQMNNMTNSPNLGSPSLNSMSNAVEQLARSSSSSGMPPSSMGTMPTSTPSPVPKSAHSPAAMTNSNSNTSSSIAHSGDQNASQTSPMSNTDTHESSSRPSSTTAAHHPDLPNNESTTGSDSSGGMPSDSTSVDSGFHSSDQGDKTSDSVSTPTQSGPSPPLSGPQPNGEASRTIENISPPGHSASHHPHQQQHQQHPQHPQHPQQHYHMGQESKMPYSNDGGVPLPPSSMSSAMSSMPSSSSSVVTTANTGPMLTSVTQSIASPVTSVSTSAPPHHPHPHAPHHMGPHGGPPHMMGHGMGPGPHGMMPNGMPPSSMMNPGHMGGPNQMPPNMGGPPHNMMPPNMGGPNMNMNQNGPMMGPNGPMMGHNGPMMPGHPGMAGGGNNANMPPMVQVPPPQQQPQQQQPQQQMNCMPPMGNNNNNNNNSSSNNTPSEDPPEKKKKVKKSSSDLTKLFEMGPEPDRRPFLERVLAFLEETGQPVTSLPVISKTPLDLYKLYFCVREKGGFEEVTRNKKWRDICTVVNIGTSASAAFTLKKNYIRYLFNYECKFDRGGINPAPILAQMEAQLAHKREQKSKRAPSPGSNSNESFRPPSVPNNQMDSSYPPNMPPPYMQNPDGSMPNPHMSGGNMMMGPNNMMGGPGPHGGMGNMMGGPPGMGPSGMMGGPPGPNMMQQGMMPPNSGAGNMMGGPQMMPGGPPGYGGPMMQQQQPGGPMPPSSSTGGPPCPPLSGASVAGPMPVTSDSISVQDPFSDESSYHQQRGGHHQPTPPPPQSMPAATSTPMSSSYPGMQQSSMGSATVTSSSGRPVTSSSGYGSPDQQMAGGYPPNSSRPNDPSTTVSGGGQFPFGQQFDHPDRFDQSSPNLGMRPPGPTPGMTPSQQPPQQPGDGGTPMYPGARFPGPPQPMGMRPPQGGDAPGQYPPQGPPYQGQGGYPGPQYPGYPQTSTGPYPGPRPPPGTGGMYGTPSKRFPDDHSERMRDGGQWSPMQRSRMSGGPGYMSPAPPSTPPMGPYGRPMSHRNSPSSREAPRFGGPQKLPPAYGGLTPAAFTKKEMSFPPDCVESVSISTTKRKKLTHKDLAPFEAWRLMLSLKSGLLAESTWALDTLNILLYDDSTYGYFSLSSLPGLLEVLTEHFRHCLMQMFQEFEDLEEGQSRKPRHLNGKLKSTTSSKIESLKENIEPEKQDVKEEVLSVFQLSGPNYTMVSRKGLPVKIDQNPVDTSVLESKDWDYYSEFDTRTDHWVKGCGDITDHILTHLESDNTNKFLSGKFRRKRLREEEEDIVQKCEENGHSEEKKACTVEDCKISETLCSKSQNCSENSHSDTVHEKESEKSQGPVMSESVDEGKEKGDVQTQSGSKDSVGENSNPEVNHSDMCNGEKELEEKKAVENSVQVKSEPVDAPESNGKECNSEQVDESKLDSKVDDVEKVDENVESNKEGEIITEKNKEIVKPHEKQEESLDNHVKESKEKENSGTENSKPLENGDIEEPKLSPMVNHLDSSNSPGTGEQKNAHASNSEKAEDKDNDNCSDSSPPVLKAECFDGEEDMIVDGNTEPMNSTMNANSSGASMEADTSAVLDATNTEGCKEVEVKEEKKTETEDITVKEEKEEPEKSINDSSIVAKSTGVDDSMPALSDSFVSESEELSASVVAEMLKEDEHTEEEAFQRDDPPLCVTPESRDELGRRCVCVSNIIRSLSCVPGNEVRICRHMGIMRILGHLLLLHHSHPERPPPRKLPSGDEEEEEREEPPRVYDDEHWWWDYLDQLRENTLVILANISGHLKLGNISEQVCFPLLEGLLHWVICPASVARDPLPTLPPGSVLSPQRLVLEALCKLSIHETNVDLLLATPPVKRLLELFGVLVRLLADRNHLITREFSIVLLSLLVPGESSAARAVALQHPCVSLLIDFLETAEQNALTIANQQGVEVLRTNPEAMGTSLDMLRRSASILLHMARVPDNRKMFMQHQSRLLNLVMSQILDQSVSNTLSEVLFECSQFS